MSRSLPEKPCARHMALAIGQHELAWAQQDGNGLFHAVHRNWHTEGCAAAVRDALAREPGVPPVLRVDLIAANDLALHWLQAPPDSLASFEELRLVAAARCAHLYGGTPSDWRITGDWRADAPFVCAALPVAVVEPVEQALAALGAQARWYTAWGLLCAACPQAFPAQGWSAVRSPSHIVLWHCSSGGIDGLCVLPVDAMEGSPGAAVRAHQQMRVEASRAQHMVPGVLHWLDLCADANSPAPAGTHPIHLGTALRPDSVALTESTAALALRQLLESVAA